MVDESAVRRVSGEDCAPHTSSRERYPQGLTERQQPEDAMNENRGTFQRVRGITKLLQFMRVLQPSELRSVSQVQERVSEREDSQYNLVAGHSRSIRSSASSRRSSYVVAESFQEQLTIARPESTGVSDVASESCVRNNSGGRYSVAKALLSSVNEIISGVIDAGSQRRQSYPTRRMRASLVYPAAWSVGKPSGSQRVGEEHPTHRESARSHHSRELADVANDVSVISQQHYDTMSVPLSPTHQTTSEHHQSSLFSAVPYGTGSAGSRTSSTAPSSRAGSRIALYSSTIQSGEDPVNERCGWLCFRPDWLQRARTSRWLLFWLCWAAAVQGMVVNGFVNVCITTIEKRFDLRSKDTGIVAGAYDMASVVCSVPVAYFGSRPGASKARWLGMGMIIMGLGSFVFALPHFVTPAYNASVRPEVGDSVLSTIKCSREAVISASCGGDGKTGWLSSFRYVFILGQLLHGVGATPLYTLGVTFLDESVPSRMSSLYLAVYYAMAVVGPAAGYVMGGQFLSLYINSPLQDASKLGLNPTSDRWLGGWWMGFLLSGCASVLVALPLFGFPNVVRDTKEESLDASQSPKSNSPMAGGINAFQEFNDFPSATRSLMSNVTFVSLSMAGATEGILLTGFATFIPKFIESQFSVAASFSAVVVGFIAVPAGGGGTLLGGWLIKKYELSCSSVLKLLFLGSLFCLLSCFSLLIYCPNQEFAGVNVYYVQHFDPPSLPSLVSTCNSNCGCSGVAYNPVCGSNNIVYYSPCHAGCTERHEFGYKEVFSNCSCIVPHLQPEPLQLGSSLLQLPRDMPPELLLRGVVFRDTCPSACGMMPYFMFLFLVMMLATFTISLPALSGTLRSVAEEQRSLALGVQWIIVRLLGTIPGPILFGMVIDYTCRLWQETCGSKGPCLSYNNFYMSRYMLGISFAAKIISSFLFFVAWWFFRTPKDPNTPMDNVRPLSNISTEARNEASNPHISYENPAVEVT